VRDFKDLLNDLRGFHEEAIKEAEARAAEGAFDEAAREHAIEMEDLRVRYRTILHAAEDAARAMESAGMSALCGSPLFDLLQAIKVADS
jgi:hypothetical protein